MSDVFTNADRHATLKRLVSELAANAHSLDEIGARVLVLQFICTEDGEKRQRTLANKLNLSDSRISRAIGFWRGKIESITTAR